MLDRLRGAEVEGISGGSVLIPLRSTAFRFAVVSSHRTVAEAGLYAQKEEADSIPRSGQVV